jgi:hypothetical protein
VSPAVWRVAGEHALHLRSTEVIFVSGILGLLLKQICFGTVARSYPRLQMCHLTRGAGHFNIQDFSQGLFKDHQVQVTNHRSLSVRKRCLPQDISLAKSHHAIVSTNDGARAQSEPRSRLVSSPIISGLRSLSAPRSSPRQRLIMECVEVVPLDELLHFRAAESGREQSGQQQRNDLDDHTSEVTPERPI